MKKSKHNWGELVAEWKQSQLSQAAFCRQKEISHSSFSYWIERLRHKDIQSTLPISPTLQPVLFPVKVVKKEKSSCDKSKLTLQIHSAVSLHFDEHVNKAALKVLLEVLGVLPC